jgi:hypothetical protein
MNIVFAALLAQLAEQRWTRAIGDDDDTPRAGQSYVRQCTTGLRQGRILEVRPPVGITLREAMVVRNCRLDQHLRFMLAPGERGTAVVVGVRYQPDGLARLRIETWHRWLLRDQQRTLLGLGERVAGDTQGAGTSGQSQGNTSMTVANITRVRGKPIFR